MARTFDKIYEVIGAPRRRAATTGPARAPSQPWLRRPCRLAPTAGLAPAMNPPSFAPWARPPSWSLPTDAPLILTSPPLLPPPPQCSRARRQSATLNYQQQLAVVVLLASREHTVTPPFELLSLPYHAASLSVQLVRGSISLVTCHDRQQRMTRLAMAVQAVSAFARTAGDGKGGNDDDSVFTRRLVKMHKMGALAPKVEAYVEKHTGDEMQDDERHNTKLHKHLHMCLNKLDVLAGEQEKRASQLSAIDGALQELAHEHEKLRDDVTELLERAGEEEPGEGSQATNEKPNPRLSRRSKTAQPPLEATEA